MEIKDDRGIAVDWDAIDKLDIYVTDYDEDGYSYREFRAKFVAMDGQGRWAALGDGDGPELMMDFWWSDWSAIIPSDFITAPDGLDWRDSLVER